MKGDDNLTGSSTHHHARSSHVNNKRGLVGNFSGRSEEKQANNSDSSERGRSRTHDSPQTGFTDAGEEQELLSRGELDGDKDGEEDGVRRRSTSQNDQSRKPQGTVVGQQGDEAQSSSRATGLREEADDDDLPTPAWRRESGPRQSWLRTKVVSIFWTVVNMLRTPAYAIPLIINLTGSIWFFLLVGKHELSLTVPLANSSAFLFTVLGEWYVERKVIAKETWLGMGLVLGGIALCVHSKNQAS
ncbi:hypothetical protein N7508_005117 [Penicillium antarcticum]|uniref:uncharacterized protein n=1 Tax=Penicillium antarcticum TaxID=416450 RepID=UPI0023A371C2|nr:uncharacterized protein N7508_005117 [Penicillium antarcticum]KAJ5306102.1 hypothetical protein N7508_005117 [Penicillium antarcticum]